MISDTQVVFRNLDHSDAVEEAVHRRAEKLQRFTDQIQSLRVIVESPHNNHHKGKVYHVGVEALIPNHDIVVNHEQHDKHSHEDIYVAIRDTFDAVERQIKDFNEKKRRAIRASGGLKDTLETETETDIVEIESEINGDIISVDEYNENQAANQ